MKLHLVGIFHTLNRSESSHCAFTGKVFRFAKMMQQRGYEVIEYANCSTSAAKEKVNILTKEEVLSLSSRTKDNDFYGNDAVVDSPLWRLFDERLTQELRSRFDPTSDIVCHPFGQVHQGLSNLGGLHMESGIGYPNAWAPYKVFESYSWMSFHQGKDKRGGNAYEWVVPNYFDLDDWQPRTEPGKYLLYFGRLISSKGLNVIVEIAKRTKIPVILCGQGDPTQWLGENVSYIPPIHGTLRSDLLSGAYAILMPTQYTEPFGGAGVEGLLCGTPMISSDYGAFAETVQNGINGFRCHTLGDYLEAIKQVSGLSRLRIATRARATYSLESCGVLYDRIFQQLSDLRSEGWYTLTPRQICPL